MSNSLQPHGLHGRTPSPPTPEVYSNSCPLSRWYHPNISSSVVSFSSRLQSFPASGSFQMSQFFASGGQSTGVSISASALPMNIQDWFPLGWTGGISLLSKVGVARGHQRADTLSDWSDLIWCFWTVVLEKTLQSPLDSKEIPPVHPKGNQSW